MAEPERSEDDMPVYRAIVRLTFPVGAGGGTNTWHVRTGSEDAAQGPQINATMQSIREWYAATDTTWVGGTAARWDGNYIRVDGPETIELGGMEPWTEQVGNDATTASPGNASMACVTWRSTQRSRSGRGRTFIGPLSETSVDAQGTLTTVVLTRLAVANTALIARSTEADFQGAVCVWSEADQVARDIVRATVTDQVAVLRSRRS